MSSPVVAVVGPTASGKSELALSLCRRFDGELVSADSVQVYRRFDIGSAKPTAAERALVPHHLVDVFDPLESVDVARFVQLARACIADIAARGKRPIVCGGTFLWVRALVYGLADAPAADEAIRARHRAEVERHGRAWLHARLLEIDPASHARLGPNDLVRVSRALEVYELTGKPLSALQAAHGFRQAQLDVRFIGVRHERVQLAERIERRVARMFEQGWLDEVRGLLRDGYAQARALRSVGYRQVAEALTSGAPLDPATLAASVSQATRVFVRRQLTWLREEPVRWIEPERIEELDPFEA
ncbi:MAG TPA: tRNA (adenosine(37)-N6)-dimethylallyltransferase MiaA [Polyangiaceae bacterium]|nr:tRNA (adenosine(37)-N6)-dimethylallyltransferase MiaA [Polyangiaceae bacterium]